ncbi:Efflux RND transporter periplasmic adaptor subunit [Rubrivivax sp. A210]|uniref:efflux RND transporter periplasmic adaptor subunit n=1 Tax=Rubrivivax sp. A210 TaxID=2772301 RepID=UPI0019AFD79B|nr:efflux RND transporter periplasmic adaptor subunit [Rubrivivax sp. A210]CAD5373675.1 Efflux RND transporter periplasmic adaptor subunit [Rubrivivax sp. A210]
MNLKKIHTLVAVIGIAAAGAAAWWWQNGAGAARGGLVDAAAVAASGAATRTGPGAPVPAQGGGPAPVEVARAERARLVDDVMAVGSLKAGQGVMLRPEVSGRIASLGFADGARVKRGQLLVQLDDTLQQAQLKQAEAQAGIARTNLQRSRELLGQGFVSASAVDQNLAALDVAEAQVALARAQLGRMKVLAPFDGTAGLRAVNVGDYVKDGADLVNIEDLSSLTVQFAVPERVLNRLRAGLPVEVTLDALPGRTFKGRVLAIDAAVDANGRALQVSAHVENPGALLRPGMFARPRVVFAVRDNAVLVPEEAVVPLGGKQMVFKVVEGAGGKKQTQRLEARLGLRLPGKVEILEGLKPGDAVVTAGHGRLLRGDGVPVRTIDLDRLAAPALAASAPASAPARLP